MSRWACWKRLQVAFRCILAPKHLTPAANSLFKECHIQFTEVKQNLTKRCQFILKSVLLNSTPDTMNKKCWHQQLSRRLLGASGLQKREADESCHVMLEWICSAALRNIVICICNFTKISYLSWDTLQDFRLDFFMGFAIVPSPSKSGCGRLLYDSKYPKRLSWRGWRVLRPQQSLKVAFWVELYCVELYWAI